MTQIDDVENNKSPYRNNKTKKISFPLLLSIQTRHDHAGVDVGLDVEFNAISSGMFGTKRGGRCIGS
jgi:hypothetical protein